MLRPFTPTRCLALLACVSCILLFTLVPRYDLLDELHARHVVSRDISLPLGPGPANGNGGSATDSGGGASAPSSPTPSLPSPNSPTPTPPSQPTPSPPSSADTGNTQPTSSPPPPDSNTNTPPTSTPTLPPSSPTSSDPNSPPSSGNTDNTSSSGPANTGAPGSSAPVTPPPTPSPTVSASLTTNENGETETVMVTYTPSYTQSSASNSASAGADQDDGSSKGVSTSTIVGLSVAGGIAFVGIIGFIVWKFTRKRFSDDFDDSEAIKWPELNAHGDDDNPLALPTNRLENKGFDNSEANLPRPDSRAGSIAPSAATSTTDLYAPNASQDPYAVPPLPHLNPNQPYRDDPNTDFYDPYNGPVPQTFAEAPGGEAIPMTQINRGRSPGPGAAYEAGRMSPGPQAAYYEGGRSSPAPGRAASPAPAMALSGRMSPGPGPALSGRASPGPQQAYGYAG